MKRHVVHLRVEIYEPKKKENNKDVVAAEKALLVAAEKSFRLAMAPYSKSQSIVILDLPCQMQTFTTALFVDIDDSTEANFYKFKEIVRNCDQVDILEPDYVQVDTPVKTKK